VKARTVCVSDAHRQSRIFRILIDCLINARDKSGRDCSASRGLNQTWLSFFLFLFLSVILFSAVYSRLEGCTVSISFSLGVIVRFHKLLKGMMRDYPRPEQVTFYH
jgi:hypothetical protein